MLLPLQLPSPSLSSSLPLLAQSVLSHTCHPCHSCHCSCHHFHCPLCHSPPSLPMPLPSLLPLLLLARHPSCGCHCPLVAIAIACPPTLSPTLLSLLPLPLPSLSPTHLAAVTIAHIVAVAVTIALAAVACPPPSLPLLMPLLPLPSSLHATIVANGMALSALALFVSHHLHHCHHHPCCPHPHCCCHHNLPHALVIYCCLPLWLFGCQCPLVSHHPPLMLPLLVDCCLSSLPWTGGVWVHHLPLLFSGLVFIQRCWGCGVAATATAILALASSQFWPSPMQGACSS